MQIATIKIIIPLAPAEAAALREIAKSEYRNPKAQAALIIRQRLEQLGLLPKPSPPAPALEVKP